MRVLISSDDIFAIASIKLDEPELKSMDVLICKLRKKLARATGGSHYIEALWGGGSVLRDPGPRSDNVTQKAGPMNAAARQGVGANQAAVTVSQAVAMTDDLFGSEINQLGHSTDRQSCALSSNQRGCVAGLNHTR